MIPAYTRQQILDYLREQVSADWWDQITSDPDGNALVLALADVFSELDAANASEASALRVRQAPGLAAAPASGAEYATTTLEIRRTKTGRSITMPTGTLVETPDGHRYATTSPLSWGGGELAAKSVSAQAVAPGWPGIIPAGAIDRFVRVANGVSGIGTEITLWNTHDTYYSIQLTTDATKPHLFRSSYVGLYFEITSCAAQPQQVGLQFQVTAVNDGTAFDADSLPESRYMWTPEIDSTVDVEYGNIISDAYSYEWVIRDWDELGFSVRNTTAATGGRAAFLDEHARARGRARLPGEADEQVRARLLRAPELPSPIGVLRKAIVALAPFGVRRSDIKIYELGQRGADPVDVYVENFPSAGGFISDLHCSDMSSPETPVGMYSKSPTYTTLSPAYDPGLALTLDGPVSPFRYLVRWDPPAGMDPDLVKQIRVLLWQSLRSSKPPGAFFQIYEITQWGF